MTAPASPASGAELDEILARARRLTERMTSLRDEIDRMRVIAYSRDGAAVVEVDGSGTPTAIHVTAYGLPPDTALGAIIDAAARAAGEADRRRTSLLAELGAEIEDGPAESSPLPPGMSPGADPG